MKYGIADNDWDSIIKVFERSPKIEKAVLFGSRAKETFRLGSDIDIALFGENILFDEILDLKLKLEDIGLIHGIDIVIFESIVSQELLDHIKRIGIIMYQRLQT